MKDFKNILILGGYGQAGMEMAKLLLGESPHNIGLAGRDQMKADREAKTLNWEHSCARVRGVQVNLGLKRQLTGILEGYDLAIDCIRETAFDVQVAKVALGTGTDYLDLTANAGKHLRLNELDEETQAAGLTFITEAGFIPGVASLLTRYLADYFDTVDTVTIDGLPGEETHSYRNYADLILNPGYSFPAFSNGSDTKAPFDRILRMLRAFWYRRVQRNSSTPVQQQDHTIRVIAAGTVNGRNERLRLTLEHCDLYRAAAISTVPCVLGLLDGSIKKPGVHMMEHVLDLERYMENLWDMGMTVSIEGLSDLKQKECQSGEIRLVEQVT